MAETEKKTSRPESPTTAREMDFDEEHDEQSTTTQPPTTKKDAPPSATIETPHPSEILSTQPVSTTTQTAPNDAPSEAQAQAQVSTALPATIPEPERTLREAFPSISPSVVRAVLKASRGELEPAFEALLEMTDPAAAAAQQQTQSTSYPRVQEQAPPQPPRPTVQSEARHGESDEEYARRLAEEYEAQERWAYQQQQRQGQGQGGRMGQRAREEDRTFFDDAMDEIPVIRENIRQGFLQTQSRVNNFLSGLKKRMDGDEEEAPPLPRRRESGAFADRSASQGRARRSGEMDRYDADPEEIRGDFVGLTMRDDEAPPQPRRPPTNPDLFKPTPKTPLSERKVGFADGTVAKASPAAVATPSGTPGKSKWTKLADADPNPLADDDPFSLGDSDDEDAGEKAKGVPKSGIAEKKEVKEVEEKK